MSNGRMLTAGGLLDQPAGLWFAQAYCGWVSALLEKTSVPGFDWEKATLSRADYKLLGDIARIRSKING